MQFSWCHNVPYKTLKQKKGTLTLQTLRLWLLQNTIYCTIPNHISGLNLRPYLYQKWFQWRWNLSVVTVEDSSWILPLCLQSLHNMNINILTYINEPGHLKCSCVQESGKQFWQNAAIANAKSPALYGIAPQWWSSMIQLPRFGHGNIRINHGNMMEKTEKTQSFCIALWKNRAIHGNPHFSSPNIIYKSMDVISLANFESSRHIATTQTRPFLRSQPHETGASCDGIDEDRPNPADRSSEDVMQRTTAIRKTCQSSKGDQKKCVVLKNQDKW